MKVRISFKTPDAVECAVEQALNGLEDATQEKAEDMAEKVRRACKKFVEYGECLTVEVDTEKGTCEVVPV